MRAHGADRPLSAEVPPDDVDDPTTLPAPSASVPEVRQRRDVQASIDELGRRIETALHEEGAAVWADMRAFAQELRSRVDDIDDQQRRTLRELTEWQRQLDERIDELAEVLRVVLRRD